MKEQTHSSIGPPQSGQGGSLKPGILGYPPFSSESVPKYSSFKLKNQTIVISIDGPAKL